MHSTKRTIKKGVKDSPQSEISVPKLTTRSSLRQVPEEVALSNSAVRNKSRDDSFRIAQEVDSEEPFHHSDDDDNLAIYHVPSFLLKTYEIVDVNPAATSLTLYLGQKV